MRHIVADLLHEMCHLATECGLEHSTEKCFQQEMKRIANEGAFERVVTKLTITNRRLRNVSEVRTVVNKQSEAEVKKVEAAVKGEVVKAEKAAVVQIKAEEKLVLADAELEYLKATSEIQETNKDH